MATYCVKCEAKTNLPSDEGLCGWCFDDVEKRPELLTVGDQPPIHNNVNRDPHLSHCLLCGKKVGDK
jgi:hypothetical protein